MMKCTSQEMVCNGGFNEVGLIWKREGIGTVDGKEPRLIKLPLQPPSKALGRRKARADHSLQVMSSRTVEEKSEGRQLWEIVSGEFKVLVCDPRKVADW